MRRIVPFLFASFAVVACSSTPDNPTGASTGSTSSGAGGHGGGAGGGGVGGGGVGGGAGGGAPAPTGPITGTVKHYDYAFDVPTAHGHSKLDVDVAAPGGDCFAVHDALTVADNPLWNGAAAKSPSLMGGSLSLCGEGVAAGAPLHIEADSTVLSKTFFGLDVGYHKAKDMEGNDFTYLLSWVGGCDRFGPCDDDPGQLASFHFDITHKKGDVVLCPGTLTTGDTVTSCDLAGTLAPTYSAFGFAVDSGWKRNDFLSGGGVNVVFYEVPSGHIAASLEKDSVTAYLDWITGLLGAYPYGNEIRYAGGPTQWLGFEHPANIVLLENLPDVPMAYQNAPMHVFMHETVHQWAGDRSTIASVPDFVWKEATAEYLSYVFEDEHRPPVEAAASLAYWDSISLQSAHYPRPTDSPAPAVQTFYGDVYGPGPMVLYVQLEGLFGRKVVLDGIKAFLATPGARSVDDHRKAMETASGKDLKAYYDAWVFGAGAPEWPTFDIATAQNGNQVTVTVTQKNASKKLYGCTLEIDVFGATTSATAVVDFGPAPTNMTAQAMVMLAEPVMSTTLDPRHKVVGRLAGSPLWSGPKLPVWPL